MDQHPNALRLLLHRRHEVLHAHFPQMPKLPRTLPCHLLQCWSRSWTRSRFTFKHRTFPFSLLLLLKERLPTEIRSLHARVELFDFLRALLALSVFRFSAVADNAFHTRPSGTHANGGLGRIGRRATHDLGDASLALFVGVVSIIIVIEIFF